VLEQCCRHRSRCSFHSAAAHTASISRSVTTSRPLSVAGRNSSSSWMSGARSRRSHDLSHARPRHPPEPRDVRHRRHLATVEHPLEPMRQRQQPRDARLRARVHEGKPARRGDCYCGVQSGFYQTLGGLRCRLPMRRLPTVPAPRFSGLTPSSRGASRAPVALGHGRRPQGGRKEGWKDRQPSRFTGSRW
jgi:hypothetical protein